MNAIRPNNDVSILYQRYYPVVTRWLARFHTPPDDVPDIVHDVFLALLEPSTNFQNRSRIGTWLFAVTHRVASTYRRRKCRSIDANAMAFEPPRPADQAYEVAEDRRLLLNVINGLSQRYRTLFILMYFEGRSAKEVGRRLGVRPGTVWSMAHRARKEFATKLLSHNIGDI